MIKYPNGKPYHKNSEKKINHNRALLSAANRGMSFEQDINLSNEYYREKGIALITKRPTPINIVKVDYAHGMKITDAYFEKQSTTDYNGVYKSRYIDFEAKNTKNKTSFPLHNIYPHQIDHLEQVNLHGGIAFFIIQFEELGRIFIIDSKLVISFYHNEERKSIPLSYLEKNGVEVNRALVPPIDYIKAVDKLYFNI